MSYNGRLHAFSHARVLKCCCTSLSRLCKHIEHISLCSAWTASYYHDVLVLVELKVTVTLVLTNGNTSAVLQRVTVLWGGNTRRVPVGLLSGSCSHRLFHGFPSRKTLYSFQYSLSGCIFLFFFSLKFIRLRADDVTSTRTQKHLYLSQRCLSYR